MTVEAAGSDRPAGRIRTVVARTVEAWRAYVAPGSFVVRDPDIRGGEPVVSGTRVPVSRLAALYNQGVSVEVLLDEHPSLTRPTLSAALRYARRHPSR
jgi:uncharacterized protein (DUF433 family)